MVFGRHGVVSDRHSTAQDPPNCKVSDPPQRRELLTVINHAIYCKMTLTDEGYTACKQFLIKLLYVAKGQNIIFLINDGSQLWMRFLLNNPINSSFAT